MAHLEKYKAHACGHMLAHYRRDAGALGRDNIDPRRTSLNYAIGVTQPVRWEQISERLEAAQEATGRAVRKDAVVMADMVITAPPNVPEADLGRFFELAYEYMGEAVGEGNLLGGYVHMDETTPHMHVPFTPVTQDGRFAFKRLCPRSFYQGFHTGLGDHLEARMGYRPAIELDEAERAKRVYTERPQDAARVREAIVAPAEAEAERLAESVSHLERRNRGLSIEASQKEALCHSLDERLESLRQGEAAERAAIEELDRAIEQASVQPAGESLSEGLRGLWKARGARGREEGLAREVEGLRSRISGLEQENRVKRGRSEELDRALSRQRTRLLGLGDRFDELKGRVRELVSRLKRVPDTLSDLTLDLAEDMGKTVYSPNSLQELVSQAREASRADWESRLERGEVSSPARQSWHL